MVGVTDPTPTCAQYKNISKRIVVTGNPAYIHIAADNRYSRCAAPGPGSRAPPSNSLNKIGQMRTGPPET